MLSAEKGKAEMDEQISFSYLNAKTERRKKKKKPNNSSLISLAFIQLNHPALMYRGLAFL